ncbi:MAG TPA: sulfotransferase [Roseiflexaceae bacterium]|nr:sulfotransferase [Roseiflexaceae bacterium]
MERGPIFIGGPDRCGKTLLRALLVSHPNIAIPAVGSNYWSYFYGQFGDLGRRENFERCLAAMLRYKHAIFLKPDAARIRREFRQGAPTYARLFALFHEHYAEREGKPRWGDQTGLIERYADPIFAAYPDARMIHMIRDPRDRYEASLALHPHGKMRVGGATARWLYSVRLAERNRRRYPDRYMIVRYETLVCQPEATLRAICAFLGETFVPAMLTMEGAPGFREKGEHRAHEAGAESPISTAYIGRFRGAIPRREIAFMQQWAGRVMAAYGYEPEPIRLSARDWAAYALVDGPLNLARMLLWRTVEALQQAFPAQIRRRPSAGMMG